MNGIHSPKSTNKKHFTKARLIKTNTCIICPKFSTTFSSNSFCRRHLRPKPLTDKHKPEMKIIRFNRNFYNWPLAAGCLHYRFIFSQPQKRNLRFNWHKWVYTNINLSTQSCHQHRLLWTASIGAITRSLKLGKIV